MEYLSRILIRMSKLDQFKFHHTLKFTHICFAHDLILYCLGKPHVYLFLRAFKLFNNSYYGLKANLWNPSIYFCSLKEEDVQRVLVFFGFSRSELPFSYLVLTFLKGSLLLNVMYQRGKKKIARICVWSLKTLISASRL